MTETDQQIVRNDGTDAADQEWLNTYMGQHPGSGVPPTENGKQQKGKGSGLAMVLVAVALIAAFAFVMMTTKKQADAKNEFVSGDLGEGVSTASGLRGHLVTEFATKVVHYKLKIEPIDPRENEGFALITGKTTLPVIVNLRVLDNSGAALCGKQIVLQQNAGSGAPAQPANGADAFKRILRQNGRVEGLWAEGTLPCSPDQFKKFDYWDFATNFPTVAEQDKMLGHSPVVDPMDFANVQKQAPAQLSVPAEAEPAHPVRTSGRRKPLQKKPQSAFYIQGDDRATEFDSTRGLLVVGASTRFVIERKSDQSLVAGWVDDDSLVHFTCDAHASCALHRAGSANLIPARMNE